VAIPIENVYYLLCYAWNRLDARDEIDAAAISGSRVENLLGHVLERGVGHLIRRGLDRGYVSEDETSRRLRGKLLLTETVGRCLLQRAQVACRVDELSHDVPHNQVIKAAMQALIGLPTLDRGIREGLRRHCERLRDVSDVPLSPASFRRIQLHRNLARYRLLLNVCQLVARCFIADERTGRRRFHPFTRQDEMGQLFEAFVRNFLKQEQEHFAVGAKKVPWDVPAAGSVGEEWLPEMRTDVLLESAAQRVVIETKFYPEPLAERYESRKLRSPHLYQLLTYLSQLGATPGPRPAGVLLYAGSAAPNLELAIGRATLWVRNLDLGQEWPRIHENLVALVEELREARV